jgi:hypothetical protein
VKKSYLLSLACVLAVGLAPKSAKADIWTVSQKWSDAKELQYQAWIQKFAQVDMFSNPKRADGSPNPYYGLTTDCADTVYSMRIIFSYENRLQWAMRNPADKTQLITQELKRFDNVPEEGGKRVKAFIHYMTGVVSTHTIDNDTYPVSINHIVPGTVILTSHKNHHSWTIVEITPNGQPRLVFNSTVGKQSGSKVQQRISWPNPFWVFEPEDKLVDRRNPDAGVRHIPVYVPGSYAGFRYWTPVDKLLADQTTIPGYSQDQYTLDLSAWKEILTRKLAQKAESLQDIVSRLLTDACADIKQRADAVVEAETYKTQLKQAFNNANTPDLKDILNQYNSATKKSENRQCLIFDRYDQYSTPSRDQRLFDAVMLARTYFKFGLRTQGPNAFTPDKLAQFKKIFTNPLISAKEESASENKGSAVDSTSMCNVMISGVTLDMAEVKRRLMRSYVSPNPNEDATGRWGGRGEVRSELTRSCPTYGDSYPPYDIDRSEKQAQDEVDVYAKSH